MDKKCLLHYTVHWVITLLEAREGMNPGDVPCPRHSSFTSGLGVKFQFFPLPSFIHFSTAPNEQGVTTDTLAINALSKSPAN